MTPSIPLLPWIPLTAFTGAAYAKYNSIFERLQADLPQLVDRLGAVREVVFSDNVAEFSIIRDTPDGGQRYLMYIIRGEDGIWRIDGM